jgi:hypothetical protein
MGEFRHRDDKLLLLVQVISYSLCSYMYSNLSVRVVLSHFPMLHVPYPCGLFQELYYNRYWFLSGRHTATSTLTAVYRYAALINN